MKDWERELEDEYRLTDEDEALLAHVFGDDEPPQGLHRRGYDRREAERRERERAEQARQEERNVEDYLYPSDYDFGFEY